MLLQQKVGMKEVPAKLTKEQLDAKNKREKEKKNVAPERSAKKR